MNDTYQAYEETLTYELRFIERSGFSDFSILSSKQKILQQKVKIRYEFNKYREEWRDIPIAKDE